MIEHIPGEGDATAMSELARVLRPGGMLVLTFPFASEARDVHVDHNLYGQRYEGTPLFFYRHYSPDTLEPRLLAASHFGVDDRAYWTKQGVQSAQAGLHRLVPARWELGKALGPVLPLIGARALVPGSPEEPGVEECSAWPYDARDLSGSRYRTRTRMTFETPVSYGYPVSPRARARKRYVTGSYDLKKR